MQRVDFSSLVGQVLTRVSSPDPTQLYFETEDKRYSLYHEQDCCESVTIEDINGNLDDLIGTPILVAEEVSNHENPSDVDMSERYQDSFTWTFYKLATRKGYVTIRWYGSSNGYYSESVSFSEEAK